MEHTERIERRIVDVKIGREVGFIDFIEIPKVGYYADRKLMVRISNLENRSKMALFSDLELF